MGLSERLIPAEVRAQLAAFNKWAIETLKLPPGFFDEIWQSKNDWTLVIMLHAMIETALNHLLISQFGRPELEEVFPHMDNSDMRRGKLAFICRLKLLPPDHVSFIQQFSSIRNKLVHNAINFGFSLEPVMHSDGGICAQGRRPGNIPAQGDAP